MAVRGDDPLKIVQRAGHADFATTQLYVRAAESVRAGFGEVFPPLPEALSLASGVLAEFRQESQKSPQVPSFYRGSWRGGRDSNPRPPA